jgi:hypothetical protein
MKFPILFVDVDGVLVNNASLRRRTYGMAAADPTCVEALNHILRETGAKIVVSSTWRAHGYNKLCRIFESWGVTRTPWSLTPDLTSKPGTLWVARERGDEIQAWLDAHPQWAPTSFVIIDDSADMQHLFPRLVRTNSDIGLTMADAERAIKMLKEKQ